jgi:hypothetical protein
MVTNIKFAKGVISMADVPARPLGAANDEGAAVAERERRAGRFYRSSLTSEERGWLDEAIALAEDERNGLDAELAAARVLLKRLLGMEGSETKAVAAALSIGRLQEIRRRLEGKQAKGLMQAVDIVLAELGLGEGV